MTGTGITLGFGKYGRRRDFGGGHKKGVKIANAIQAVVKQNLPNVNVVKVGDAATFSRGDVQVNLY